MGSNEALDELDEVRSPRQRPAPKRGGDAKAVILELVTFRRMVAPLLIQVLFWVGLFCLLANSAWMVVAGVGSMVALRDGWGALLLALWGLGALFSLAVGTLLLRLWCELAIVLFRCHEALHVLATRKED